jgi:hypothetical protein
LRKRNAGSDNWSDTMRYLVTARLKPGAGRTLAKAIGRGTLGAGSIAGDEYLRNMDAARLHADGRVRWVEVCYCPEPLMEERPYWEEYFALEKVQDAHARTRCRDLNGSQPWACSDCDCTARLDARLESKGVSFVAALRCADGEDSGPATTRSEADTGAARDAASTD